jgi:hypothetical protein
VDADGERDVVAVDQLAHRTGESLPVHVGLGALQQEELDAGVVGEQVQRQVRRGVVDEPVLGERHLGPPRPVVVEQVDVEARDQPRVQHFQQVLRGGPAGLAGVHEPVESVDQHPWRSLGPARHRLVDDLVEVVRSQHRRLLTR